jgi:hypothetical protein
MTVLLAEYLKHRDQGHGHHGALKALARRFTLDHATAARVIDRAQRTQAQGGDSIFSPATPSPLRSGVSLPDLLKAAGRV